VPSQFPSHRSYHHHLPQGARTIAITYSNSLFTSTTCLAAKDYALLQASTPYKLGTCNAHSTIRHLTHTDAVQCSAVQCISHKYSYIHALNLDYKRGHVNVSNACQSAVPHAVKPIDPIRNDIWPTTSLPLSSPYMPALPIPVPQTLSITRSLRVQVRPVVGNNS
jgi:hypothetical protein